MLKTLLWEAFSQMEPAEIRDFSKWIRSPFFNSKPQLVVLFDCLCRFREAGAQPDAAQAFAAMYPDQPFQDAKMRLANSELLAQLEQYWIYVEKMRHGGNLKTALSAQYRRKNLNRHFQISLREARMQLDAEPWRHVEYYDESGRIEWEQFQFASAQKRYDTFNLQEISDLMDTAFAARKLRHFCLGLSHAAVTGAQYQFGMIDDLYRHIDKAGMTATPAVGLYYHAGRFLSQGEPAETDFHQFRSLLTAHARQFPPDELRTLYLLALNFCIKNSNTSTRNAHWYAQTLSLYREALTLEILLENGVLSRFAFNNIVGVAVRLGEIDWAESFIESFSPKLERRFKAAVRSLNLARVAYARLDYSTALQLLQNADYRDFISSMNAKVLLLKIYFETDEYDLLESHLDSIKTYLKRRPDALYHRENYLRLARYTRLLLKLDRRKTDEVAQFAADVQNHPTLLEKEWFLKQLGG